MTLPKEAGLHLPTEQFTFHNGRVKQLQSIVGVNGITVDPEAVQVVDN
jgi:hypothetical protein